MVIGTPHDNDDNDHHLDDLLLASRVRRLSVDELRRSSPLTRPTRTLRISEAEHSRTTPSPTIGRPRNRTPRRYESPLDPDEFRRHRVDNHDDDDAVLEERIDARRITIQPNAGRAVGTAVHRIREDRPVTPKSRKQGPSHRKQRRWNNEHFGRLAHELRGTKAGDVLHLAAADAHLYRTAYDPSQHESVHMKRLLRDPQWQKVRDDFFEGNLGPSSSKPAPSTRSKGAEVWFQRLDGRLRPIVLRACANSASVTHMVQTLENFLVLQFTASNDETTTAADNNNNRDDERQMATDWWREWLVASPTTSDAGHTKKTSDDGEWTKIDRRRTVDFWFPVASSQGGFHRLLLHAVAQFHGLSATSKVIHGKARVLAVTGAVAAADAQRYYLVDYVQARQAS